MQKFLECTDTLHFLRCRSMVPVPKKYFKRRQFQISWADNCLGSQLVTICTVASRLRRQSPILISILLGSLPYPTRCRISEDALPVVTDRGGSIWAYFRLLELRWKKKCISPTAASNLTCRVCSPSWQNICWAVH